MPWIRACSVDELEDGDALRIPTVPPVAVFRSGGEFFALNDTCTHGQSSLADGYVERDQVECAWHFAKFDLRTGSVLTPPATLPLCTYQLKVDGDDVMVEIPDQM